MTYEAHLDWNIEGLGIHNSSRDPNKPEYWFSGKFTYKDLITNKIWLMAEEMFIGPYEDKRIILSEIIDNLTEKSAILDEESLERLLKLTESNFTDLNNEGDS